MRVPTLQQGRHLLRPIRLGPSGPRRHNSPASQGFREQEHGGRANPLILVVGPIRIRDRGRCLCAGLAHQLHRPLVDAQHRVLLIVRPGIGFQYLVHCRDELGVVLRQRRAEVQVDGLGILRPVRALLVADPDDVLLTHGGFSSEADLLTQPATDIWFQDVRFGKTLDEQLALDAFPRANADHPLRRPASPRKRRSKKR